MLRILLISIFLLIPTLCHEYDPAGWKAASEWIKKSLDQTVDPCDDFLTFSCGKWNESFGELGKSEPAKVYKELAATFSNALNKIKITDPKTEEFKKSMKIFYDQCTKRPKFDKVFESAVPLLEDIYANLAEYLLPHIVEKVDNSDKYPWENSTSREFWKFVGTLQQILGTPFLMEAQVLPVLIGCRNLPVLHLRPADPPNWSEEDKFIDFLLAYVARYHNQSFEERDVNDTKSTLIEFKAELSNLHKSTVEVQNSIENVQIPYNRLSKNFPLIDWDAYFDGLLPADIREIYINSNPLVILEYPGYIRNLSANLIALFDHLTATNFGFTHALIRYSTFFLLGSMKSKDRRNVRDRQILTENSCLDLTVRYFSPAALRLLCDEHRVGVENWRNDILLLKNLIFSAFSFLVYSTEWLSPREKMVIIDKANRMNFYGDIPAWIMNDTVVNRKTPAYDPDRSLVANDIFAQKELFRQSLEPLISGEMDDAPPMFWQNAWNDGRDNIRFLIGIQLPPYFTYAYPLAVKFGALGMIISHEMMHSFATHLYLESSFAKYKTKPLALKNSTFDALKSKVECTIPFYNSYCSTESELFDNGTVAHSCTIGNNTVEENTADTEGLKIAYTAYKFATQTLGSEPLLTDLTQYSMDQLFFMAYARRSCAVDSGLKFISRDPHSSKKARIEQPLMNFPPFAKAFGCINDQRFYRKEVCSVYGNILE